jgi:hypothetical protein
MKGRMIKWGGVLVLLISHACASAEESAGAIRFGAPEVLKLDWNTRCPRVADINGDGRPDLVLLNLDRARVEFLIQGPDGPRDGAPEKISNRDRWNPILEWSRFDKQPLVVGQPMYSLAVGDWNDDGRIDVAYTTDDGHLVWRFQGEQSFDWSAKKEYALDSVSSQSESLTCADLNGDGRLDLALMTETRLLVWLQGAKGQWPDPQVYALSEPGAMMLRAADLDGDQRIDLFATSGDGATLLVRRQLADGTFGEEWALEVPQSGTWLQSIQLAEGKGLVWLQDNTNMTQVARLEPAADAAKAEFAATLRHAIPPSDSRTGASVFGDITGDGVGDVVIAEPKGARVWVFAGDPTGGFAGGQEYPALSGVEMLSIADVTGDGKNELVLFSAAEKVIGVSQWEKGRLTYPETVYQSQDTLVAMTAGRFRGGQGLVFLEEKKPKVEVVRLHWEKTSKAWKEERLDLTGGPTKVSALRLLDADQDGEEDLLLFSALSPMQIRLSRRDAKDPLLKATGLLDSMTSKLTPGALTQADVTGDGKMELIAAKDQLARAFVIGPDGKARIVEQFNAPSASAKIAAALVWQQAGSPIVLMADTQEQKLHELAKGEDGVFRVRQSRELPKGSFDEALVVQSAAGKRLLLMNKDRFEVMPLEGPSLELKVITAFDSELKDTAPSDILAAAFSGGDSDDLLLIDADKTRVLEFFTATTPEAHEWRSVLYFPVFQVDPHYRGKKGYEMEPHDYAVMDINGDGKLDLCLLVHDRLLLYVTKPAE